MDNKTRRKKRTPPLILALFLLVFFQRSTVNVLALNYTNFRHVSCLGLARIRRHLDKINKPAIKTIESLDKDIIDCVHRHKQPALDHPLLKNHKIQRAPPEMPRMRVRKEGKGMRNKTNGSEGTGRARQTRHLGGERCPKGTVPIRRSSVNDVLRAKSLYHFWKKQRIRRLSLPTHQDTQTKSWPTSLCRNGTAERLGVLLVSLLVN